MAIALQQVHRLRFRPGVMHHAAQTLTGPSSPPLPQLGIGNSVARWSELFALGMPGVSAGISMVSAGKFPSPPVPKYPMRPEARYCLARSGMSSRAG
eukprot:scaffold83696_cov68-Attheya_sp.AAC.3